MFDPYHKWLGIPKNQRPPTLYQLLGVAPDEADPEVIEEACLRQSSHLRAYQMGPHAAECTRILNEIAQAKTILLNPAKRRAYDAKLAARSGPAAAAVTASAPSDLDFSAAPPGRTRSAAGPKTASRGNYLLMIAVGGGAAAVLAIGIVVLVVVMSSRPGPDPLADGRPKQDAKTDKLETKVDLKKKVADIVVPPDAKIDPKTKDASKDPKDKEDTKVVQKVDPKIAKVPREDPPVDPVSDPVKIIPSTGNDAAQYLFTSENPGPYDGMRASPDGNLILRINANNKVELFNTRTRTPTVIGPHGGDPFRFSTDAAWVYSAKETSSNVFRLSPRTNVLVNHVVSVPVDAAFNRDNTLVAISVKGDPARADGKPVQRDDKKRPIVAGCAIQVLDISVANMPRQAFNCTGMNSPAESLVFAADGSILASGNDGLRRFDGTTGQLISHFDHDMRLSRISGDGKRVIGVESPLRLASWSIDDEKVLSRHKLEHSPGQLVVSRDGRYALSATSVTFVSGGKFDETVLWDLQTGEKLRRNDSGSRWVSLSDNGRIAVFQDRVGRRVHRWDLGVEFAKMPESPPAKEPPAGATAVARIDLPPLDASVKDPVMLAQGAAGAVGLFVSRDGNWMMHNANPTRSARLTHTKTGETHALPLDDAGTRYCLSVDGKVIAAATGKRVFHGSFDDLKNVRSLDIAGPRDLALSRDGSLLAVGAMGSSPNNLSLSPKAHSVLTPYVGCFVHVIDRASGEITTCSGHVSAVESVAIADDGTILSSGRDGLRRWHAKTGKPLAHFEHNLFPSRIAADGKTVVGFDVTTLQFTAWDIAKEKIVTRSKALPQLPDMLMIGVSPDGRFVQTSVFYSASKEESLTIIDLSTGEQSRTLPTVAQVMSLFPDGLAYYVDLRGNRIMRWQPFGKSAP